MKKKLNIEVDCASCAAKAEDAIRAVPGVISASVSFVTQKLSVEAEDSMFPDILQDCYKAARKAVPDFEMEF